MNLEWISRERWLFQALSQGAITGCGCAATSAAAGDSPRIVGHIRLRPNDSDPEAGNRAAARALRLGSEPSGSPRIGEHIRSQFRSFRSAKGGSCGTASARVLSSRLGPCMPSKVSESGYWQTVAVDILSEVKVGDVRIHSLSFARKQS